MVGIRKEWGRFVVLRRQLCIALLVVACPYFCLLPSSGAQAAFLSSGTIDAQSLASGRVMRQGNAAVCLCLDDGSSSSGECHDENPENDDNSRLLEEFKLAAEKMLVEKTREKLEQDNIKSFLKRRPKKLPYEDARRWVQANLGADTKEEFDDLVANGNLRTPYVPKRPEEYYTRTNEWISWDHFLRGIFDERRRQGDDNNVGGSDPPPPPSAVEPSTGIFD